MVLLDSSILSLPLIDISPFIDSKPPNPATHPTTLALRTALHTHGFFYLTNHSIPRHLTDRVISLARTFFTEASPAQKDALKRREAGDGMGDGGRGYQQIGENVTIGHRDWHEALDWYAPIQSGEGITDIELAKGFPKLENGSRGPPYSFLRGINLWPSYPSEFRAVYEEYVTVCRKVGEAVLLAMGYCLELQDPEFFVKAAKDSFWVMRAIGYPPLEDALAKTGGVSCGEHTDYGCLTLLLDDGTPDALQVWLTGEQGEGKWVNVQPLEGALVVNIGDMVQRWTGGEVLSTKHRVVHTGKNFRVSVPFFLEPGWDVMVECLKEFKPSLERRAAAGEPVPSDSWKEIKYGDFLTNKVAGNFYGGPVESG